MKSLFLKATLLAAFSMGVAACSGGGGSDAAPSREPTVPDTPFDTKSCAFDYAEGGEADLTLLAAANIETVSFGKRFNSNLLKAVGRANIETSIDFINQTNARLYQSSRVNTTECSKDLFAVLPTLPSDLQKKWNSANPTDPKSVLLGLYLPKDDRNENVELPSVRQDAALIVRTNTNRWTLVHEFMHHVFMLQAVAEGYNEAEARKNLDSSIDAYNAIVKNDALSDSQALTLLGDAFVEMVKAYDVMLVHFTLEEMTIEQTMKEYVRNNDLTFIPNSSNWYIHSSDESARETYQNLLKRGKALSDFADKLGGHENVKTKINSASLIINPRLSEMSKITTQFPNFGSMLDRSIRGRMGIEIHEGCSHQFEADRILDLSRRL